MTTLGGIYNRKGRHTLSNVSHSRSKTIEYLKEDVIRVTGAKGGGAFILEMISCDGSRRLDIQ